MSDTVSQDDFTAALARVGDDIDSVNTRIDDVATAVGTVLTLVENPATATSATTARHNDGVGPWCWADLDGPARVALWHELADWVAWFNTRYGCASASVVIPPCWPHHPVAVEELTALMVSWRAAHAITEPSDALIVWHDRWLWPCLDRLRDRPGMFKHCTVAAHVLRHQVQAPPVPLDLEDVITADATPHLASAPPMAGQDTNA